MKQNLLLLINCLVLTQATVFGSEARLTENHLSKFAPIAEGIKRATELRLYEGLPHQTFEKEALETELRSKKTVQIQKFPFYEQTLDILFEDIELLKQLCVDGANYKSNFGTTKHPDGSESVWKTSKFCGGFHPDYCLAWKDGDVTYDLLICFGCQEMTFFGPKTALNADIREHAYQKFETILKKYRGQRPQKTRTKAIKSLQSTSSRDATQSE